MTIIVGTKFHAKQTISNFATKFAPKKVFPIENRKTEQLLIFFFFFFFLNYWILHIQISLDTEFQVKLIILIFRTKFALKEYFRSKTE